MTARLPVALAVISVVGASVVSAAQTAKAQPNEGPARHHFEISPADRAAFLDARIAALHAGLVLTPDQDKLWPPVAQSLRDFAKLISTQRQTFRDEQKPLDPVARLEMRSANLVARGEALKKIADAEKPLYATLTEDQKHRLPILLAAIRHPFFAQARFAMMGGRHGMMVMRHRWMDEDDQEGGAPANAPAKN